jgi:hypothetical protein
MQCSTTVVLIIELGITLVFTWKSGGGEGTVGIKSQKCAKTQVFIGIQQTQLYLRADDNNFTSQKFQIPVFPGFKENLL